MFREELAQGKGGIVVLGENQCATLQPGDSLEGRAEDFQHPVALGIALVFQLPGELVAEAGEKLAFLIGKRIDALAVFVQTVLIVDFPLLQHAVGGIQAGHDRTADPALELSLDESGGGCAFVQRLGKILRQLQRQADAVGGNHRPLVTHRHQLDLHQLAFLLQPFPRAFDDADREGIEFPQINALQLVLVEFVDLVEIRVADRVSGDGNAERVANEAENIAVVRAWQRVFPPLPLRIRTLDFDPARQDVEHRAVAGIPPIGKLRAQNLRISHRQHGEQIPQLDGMKLHRRRRRQHHGPGPGGQLDRPLVEQVHLRSLPDLRCLEIRTPDLMRLVPQHTTEAHFQQVRGELAVELAAGRAKDHRRRYDGDLARAVRHVVLAGRMEFVALGEPAASGPERARGGELVHQFLLPLADHCLGGDDQDRFLVQGADELGQATELKGFAESHAVG